ncbi:MAG: hypothetical protein GY845_28995 [Planctomycetes bacterium]|nr:hypothetical protein [Planctomycetota bacterium]
MGRKATSVSTDDSISNTSNHPIATEECANNEGAQNNATNPTKPPIKGLFFIMIITPAIKIAP